MTLNLIELTPGALYLPGAVNAGVVAAPDGGAILIDTGQDKDHAKAIVKACRDRQRGVHHGRETDALYSLTGCCRCLKI